MEDPEDVIHANTRLEENCLSDNDLTYHCPLDNGRHIPRPKYNIGSLDRLPTEILTAVLYQLDLQSLTDFRRVNQQAMVLVDSIPQYRVVLRYASDAIRGMLSIGSARFNSCRDLYERLARVGCESCGDFGGFLYLITCVRVCFLCLSERSEFLPLRASEAGRKFGLKSKDLKNIPHIRSRPGLYSANRRNCRSSVTLYDHDFAKQAGIRVHGTESAMNDFLSIASAERQSRYVIKISECRRDDGTLVRIPKPPRGEDPWDAQCGNPFRFVASVPLPYFDGLRNRAFYGFYCEGCRDEGEGPDYRDEGQSPFLHHSKQFLIDTFPDHIAQWGEVVNGFHRKSANTRFYH